MALITLLTDFGQSDEYVGVMKGVIYSINPNVGIIDLTHRVDPQDVTQAAYLLKASYPYFPQDTIHVVVVDPGVGTDRKIVALKIDGQLFLAPDNGVLSLLWQNNPIEDGVWVNNARYFLRSISRTFHGRDIFAPVAAWLSTKIPIQNLGPPVTPLDLETIKIPNSKISSEHSITGTVIWVDHFGNLMTNIEEGKVLQMCQQYPEKLPVLRIGNHFIKGLSVNYSSVAPKKALIIIGSRGYLEIAVNCGNASQVLEARKGDSVAITMEKS